MTHEEIIELFIGAAEIDRRLPNTARPAVLKAQALPYFHDQEDIRGWGGERYEEQRLAFWEARSLRVSAGEVTMWEHANALIVHVPNERHRRCLWAWAKSKAGGISFTKWCRMEEHIHRNYGMECKAKAIDAISEYFVRNVSINVISPRNSTLRFTPEIDDIPVNIEEPRKFAWMAPGAFVSQINAEAQDFSWADAQNDRRRQREARKRATTA